MNTILFDLDDTLTHRGNSISAYAHEFLKEFSPAMQDGVSVDWIADQLIASDKGGYGGRDKRDELIMNLDIWKQAPTASQLTKHWSAYIPFNPEPMPGLHKTLSFLKHKGYSMGIISNGGEKTQLAKINALEIGSFFTCITTSGEAGLQKPGPEIFNLTLEKMNAKASETIFLGDHPVNDYQGALGAGITPVWFKGFHTWPNEITKAKYVVEDLFSITKIALEIFE